MMSLLRLGSGGEDDRQGVGAHAKEANHCGVGGKSKEYSRRVIRLFRSRVRKLKDSGKGPMQNTWSMGLPTK